MTGLRETSATRELSGKLAVVTGAANGIGAACARALIEGGASLVAIDIAPIDLSALGQPVEGASLRTYSCDVVDAAAVRSVCASIRAEMGDPDILVNNAGGSGSTPTPAVEDVTDEIWQFVMDLNVTSAMRLCREFAEGMRRKGSGRIVNMSSSVRTGVPGPLTTLAARLPYVVAKTAVVGLTIQLSKELAPFGICVNAVAPGMILPGKDARLTKKFNSLDAALQNSILGQIAMGRVGTGEEVAATVRFLSGPGSSYVSGAVVDIRGG